MTTVVGIRFKKAGKIYYFSPGDLKIAAGDNCIVETARGIEFGEVVVSPKDVSEDDVVQPLKQVLRVATPEDEAQTHENKKRAKKAFDIGLQKIAEHNLPMKLVDAEYTFDDSKLIFYFTSDGRVDFRELVKDLASIFRTRIELRQIGVRDEAKMIGGLGSCGRGLCCASFLGDFEPVSIKMAKEQNLSLNPTKISGICGRLMCCLRYESDTYKENKSVFGDNCLGCKKNMTDEFYEGSDEDEDYYADLMKEDSIKKVDYEMLRETAEIDARTRVRNPQEDAAGEGVQENHEKRSKKKTGNRKRPRKKKPNRDKEKTSSADAKPAASSKRPRRKNRSSNSKPREKKEQSQ